jgi:hypothetical protein
MTKDVERPAHIETVRKLAADGNTLVGISIMSGLSYAVVRGIIKELRGPAPIEQAYYDDMPPWPPMRWEVKNG